jgi:hypothetical protein
MPRSDVMRTLLPVGHCQWQSEGVDNELATEGQDPQERVTSRTCEARRSSRAVDFRFKSPEVDSAARRWHVLAPSGRRLAGRAGRRSVLSPSPEPRRWIGTWFIVLFQGSIGGAPVLSGYPRPTGGLPARRSRPSLRSARTEHGTRQYSAHHKAGALGSFRFLRI